MNIKKRTFLNFPPGKGKIEKAYEFAKNAHKGQCRKNKKEPYFNHPKKVYSILKRYTENTSLLCAALLHDVVEDTPTSLHTVKKEFGLSVMQLVKAVSEPLKHKSETKEQRKKSWLSRKEHTIEIIGSANRNVKMLSCADKLANLSDMKLDLEKVGKKLWKRFNATQEEIEWYYGSLFSAYLEGDAINDTKLFERFVRKYVEVFGEPKERLRKNGKSLLKDEMKQSTKMKKQIVKMDKEMKKLQKRKERLVNKAKLQYCPECEKYCLQKKCTYIPHYESKDWIDYWEVICPKKHKFCED